MNFRAWLVLVAVAFSVAPATTHAMVTPGSRPAVVLHYITAASPVHFAELRQSSLVGLGTGQRGVTEGLCGETELKLSFSPVRDKTGERSVKLAKEISMETCPTFRVGYWEAQEQAFRPLAAAHWSQTGLSPPREV
jgi:hypothetical protein